eukprot:7226246-Alexandrium_andersonii.AAC.1
MSCGLGRPRVQLPPEHVHSNQLHSDALPSKSDRFWGGPSGVHGLHIAYVAPPAGPHRPEKRGAR